MPIASQTVNVQQNHKKSRKLHKNRYHIEKLSLGPFLFLTKDVTSIVKNIYMKFGSTLCIHSYTFRWYNNENHKKCYIDQRNVPSIHLELAAYSWKNTCEIWSHAVHNFIHFLIIPVLQKLRHNLFMMSNLKINKQKNEKFGRHAH